jgi:hypothetical protein
VAAHRIAVVDRRLPFEQAYCLARLVIDHAGGPFVAERAGVMSFAVFKLLAAEDLVSVTTELNDNLRPRVELTISKLFVEKLGMTPPVGLRRTGYITSSRRKITRYVEATEQGADLVVAAVRAAGK